MGGTHGLNALPSTYKTFIQGMTSTNELPSFDKLTGMGQNGLMMKH